MPNTNFSRRRFLTTTLAAPFVASLPSIAQAGAPMLGAALPPYRRFMLGSFEVTTLLAGTREVPNPHNIFGINASDEDFAAASAQNLIPVDRTQMFFTPTLVNTGPELILFDTGLSPTGTTAALEAAGYTTDQVDRVVITHMHSDHFGGIFDGTPTFGNASYVTGGIEMEHWDFSGDEGFEAKVRPLEDQFDLLDDGDDVVSGVTAVAAFGHTPGHMAYHLESDGKRLLLGADFANHYVYSLAHPDWEMLFDADRAQAAKTRRHLLDMLATDKIPFVGYHMPFPSLGFVETRGDGFAYVPESYQVML
ncbi:MBL fold metallo-hydrolase [Celeribacter arenosi]|uniref:MBL fold metallo-hydrolase n=1 Tax=Celeribacter arenosi TaxID=792649 RepID=A0ABP7K750_9RHOB